MATILEIIQDICGEIKLPSPSSAIGSGDANVSNLVSLIQDEGRKIRDEYEWPILNKEYTFSTSNGTAAYALPGDYHYILNQTLWDRTNHWPLRGPLSPAHWQDRKSGINTVTPRSGFRFKGFATNQFYIEPTPTDTRTLAYEYQTKTWILPVTWTNATAFEALAYCSYNGTIYRTTAGGTSSGTSPADDVGVTWTAQTSAYERFVADTDVPLLDADLLRLAGTWRWKKENGFEWESYKQECMSLARRKYAEQKNAPVVSPLGGAQPYLIGPWSVPDSGFGA